MITERQANLAREKYSNYLVRHGAHAISVDEIDEDGKKTFVIKVFVDHIPEKMPSNLILKSGKKTLKVPLIVEVEEKFIPE